jgi:hypothetical protein
MSPLSWETTVLLFQTVGALFDRTPLISWWAGQVGSPDP